MMEMNGNEKKNELRKVLYHIHEKNLMKEVFLFSNKNDGYGWMEYVMKVFQKNDIDSIAILVRRSHELVDKIPNDALKIIMNHAITLHERNVREAARKIAFKEADIPFEILPERSSQFVFVNKETAYRTYTVMKKNRKKTRTMTERTLEEKLRMVGVDIDAARKEEKLRRLGVDIDAARKDANFKGDEVVTHDEEGKNKVNTKKYNHWNMRHKKRKKTRKTRMRMILILQKWISQCLKQVSVKKMKQKVSPSRQRLNKMKKMKKIRITLERRNSKTS